MNIGAKIGAGFAIGLVIIAAIGISAYVSTQRLIDANRWVTHTHEVIENLEHVLSVHKDAETGQRGFVLTGEKRYLEPYNAATGEVQNDIEELAVLTRDNASQQESLQQVQKLSNAKLSELRETIEIRRKSGLDAALPIILADRGKKIMDDMRGVIAEMEKHEQQLLDKRNAAADTAANRTIWTIVAWMPIALLILALTAVVLMRTVRFGGSSALPSTSRRKWGGIAIRYASAVIIVAAALALRMRLVDAFGPLPAFILLYPAVLLVASIGGGGPGILATVLAALVGTYWFFPPYGHFSITAPNDVLALGIFTGSGLFLSVLAERLRRARWAEAVSVAQEQQLEELSRLNEELSQQSEELSQQSEELAQQNEELQTQSEEIHTLNTELRHREDLLQKLLDSARLAAAERAVMQDICAAAKEMFGPAASAVLVLEPQGSRLTVHGQAGLGPEGAKLESFPAANCFAELVIAENKTAALADASLRPDLSLIHPPGEQPFQSVLAAPMRTEGRPFGVVGVYSGQKQEWTAEQFRLADWLAAQCTRILETLRLQEQTRRQHAVVQGINRMLQEALACETEEELGGICLTVAEELTQSKSGFIGAINVEGRLDDIAISDPGWAACKMMIQTGHTGYRTVPGGFEIHGIYGRVLLDGKGFFTNDPPSHPDTIGLPDGHPPLTAFLGVPLTHGGKTIGMVGLANREGGYHAEQLEALEALAAGIVQALMRNRAETALRESEEKYRDLVQNANSIIIRWDMNGNFTFFNEFAEKFFGFSQNEIIGKNVMGTIVPHTDTSGRDLAAMIDDIKRQPDRYGTNVNENVRNSGERVWISWSNRAIRDERGNMFGVLAVGNDITAQKQAEEAGRRSQELLQAIIDNTPALIYVKDLQGRITVANRSLGDAVGMEIRGILGKTSREFVADPQDAELHVAHDRQVIETEQAIMAEESSRGRVFLSMKFPLRDAQGRIFATGGVSTDITERKQVERSLARLAAIVESSDDAILSTDLNGMIQTWNAGAERLFGYRAEDVVGQPITLLLPPERIHEEEQILENLLSGQRVEHLETVRVAKDGRRLDVSVTASPVKGQDSEIIGASKILRDISARKRAEEALQQTAEDLTRSNKDLEQFAYVASHDLREPLRMVTGFMSLLTDRCQGKLDAKADEYIFFASDAASRMQGLIDDLLTYSRAGQGEVTEPTDIGAVLDSVLRTLTVGIQESGAVITHDPLPTIASNPVELTQVFQNLIGNAIKFKGERKPEIHVGAQRQPGDWLFTVRDNGIGIDQQFADRIFMIFQRLHTREQYPGTGIGLAVCKKIVERHGGRIWVESQPGNGSSFCFTIPDKVKEQE